MALVTSASRDLAGVRMAAAGIGVPAVSVTSEDVMRGKPHPEGYLRAASLLGVARPMRWCSRTPRQALPQASPPASGPWR
ncbi:hypothetical protein [Arthrobacter sp. NicSoilC12]|uniref:hypothetical protein n=1 Tax=Arthrobacter sp. NicSoilC12 TaxID=2831001 RepID=UPI0035B554C2